MHEQEAKSIYYLWNERSNFERNKGVLMKQWEADYIIEYDGNRQGANTYLGKNKRSIVTYNMQWRSNLKIMRGAKIISLDQFHINNLISEINNMFKKLTHLPISRKTVQFDSRITKHISKQKMYLINEISNKTMYVCNGLSDWGAT